MWSICLILLLSLLLLVSYTESMAKFVVMKKISPICSFKSFIVLAFMFLSLTHFELIYGVKERCSFILLHVGIQFLQHHLLKTDFPH